MHAARQRSSSALYRDLQKEMVPDEISRVDQVAVTIPPNGHSAAVHRPAWQRNLHHILDLTATVILLIIFLSLEAAHTRIVFMVNATLYKHSYPYKPNTVPSWAVPVYSIGVPLVAFITWKFVPTASKRLVAWFDVYRVFVAALFAIFLTAAITDGLKVAIGRPRPNFVYQCWPDGKPVWSDADPNGYGGYPVCADPEHAKEFHKSFPSGHSSWSAAGLGFLTFWLLGQTRAFVGAGRSWSLLVSLIPSIMALVVGITRITDYWHNVSDVCFGLALGFVISLITYLQLFPFFTHDYCDVPRYALYEVQPLKAPVLDDGRPASQRPLNQPGMI